MDRPIPGTIVLRQAGEKRRHTNTETGGGGVDGTSNTRPITSSSSSSFGIPNSFSSQSHDEFSKRQQSQSRRTTNNTTNATNTNVTSPSPPSSRSTLYRSSLTSRPLLRTLHAVLASLVGFNVTVELKNGLSTRGTLREVDTKVGSIILGECTIYGRKGGGVSSTTTKMRVPTKVDSLYLPGHGVRYIHLPDRVDIRSLLTRWEGGQDERLLQYKRKKRQGKFTTREEQERQIDIKERKLAIEMEATAAAAAAAQRPTSLSSSTPPPPPPIEPASSSSSSSPSAFVDSYDGPTPSKRAKID